MLVLGLMLNNPQLLEHVNALRGLHSASYDAELDKLKKLLNDNPTLRIRINGHTDNVGTDNDNLNLSANRAKSVYEYLIQKGIAASRLEYKGFGESKPVATNDTAEGRQENRRTEFELLN